LDGTFVHGFPPGVYCNPATDGTLFYSGSWSGYYFAFDKDGKLIWRTQTNNGNLHGGLPDSSAPVVWGNHLYVQKIGHYLAAINLKTGNIDWEWTGIPGFLQNGTVAAHDGMIYGSVTRVVTTLPYNTTLIAFSDVENGAEIKWRYRGGAGLTTPVLTEDKVVFGASGEVFLTCLDPDNGTVKWRFYTGGEMMENGPALYGNKFYAHCKNGWLYAIQ
jgi:outer membrane protein assembly factor BamB